MTPAFMQAISPALLDAYASKRDRDASRRLVALIGALAFILALALVPLVASGSFELGRYSTAIVYVMAALGLDLALGLGGELVLGHAVIMAASAYSAGILSDKLGWSFSAAFFPAILGGVAAGTLMMLPGLRVRGWYLALITLFAVLALPHAVLLFEPWTAGEFGLTGLRPVELFGFRLRGIGTYLLIVVWFAIVWFFREHLVRSHWGYRFRALRDLRGAAEAVGINPRDTRLVLYVVTSIPPAIGGVLLAFSERFVHFDSFNINLSLLLLTGVVLGGQGMRWGPVVGMMPLLALSFWVGPFSQLNSVGLGAGLLVCAVVFPSGLVPKLSNLLSGVGVILAKGGGRAALDAEIASYANFAEPVDSGRPNADDLVFSVRDVAKNFGGMRALSGVTLDVGKGRLVGLVGPNGSGKSTFLNVMSGFVRATTGRVRIAGQDVTDWPVHTRVRAGVGRTFQVPQLIDDMTALENIELGLLAQDCVSTFAALLLLPGARRKARQRELRALQIFAQLGLPESILDLPASSIPLGLKRVVEVGRAIASDPILLLLDEPTAGLNDEERALLGAVLVRLRDGGMTILVVEHNVPFVLEYCDEIVLLEGGTISTRADCSERLPERLRQYLSYAPDQAADARLTLEPGQAILGGPSHGP